MAHLTAWPQPGGGHLRHIPLQPPYRDPCLTAGPRPISRSFSELQEGARTGPQMGLRRADSQRELKEGSQSRISRGSFPKSSATSHRFVSCRVASHRVALMFDQDHKAFKKQKQGRPEYSLQRTPPLKSFRCIHSGVVVVYGSSHWALAPRAGVVAKPSEG